MSEQNVKKRMSVNIPMTDAEMDQVKEYIERKNLVTGKFLKKLILDEIKKEDREAVNG